MSVTDPPSNNPIPGPEPAKAKPACDGNCYRRLRKSPHPVMAVGGPVALFAWLVISGLCAIGIIFLAWPDSDWLISRHEAKVRPGLVAEIGKEGITRLQKAQLALQRWQHDGASFVTRADELAIAEAFAYAASLPLTNSTSTNLQAFHVALGGNLASVSRKDLTEDIQTLNLALQYIRDKYLTAKPEPAASPNSARTFIRYFWKHYLFLSPNDVTLSALDEALVRERAEKLRKDPANQKLTGSAELSLFALLAAFGALGACVQGVHSIAVYMGQERFLSRWSLFYISRPLVGGGVAVAIYFLLRAGIFSPGTAVDGTSVYGACAVAVMVGLFSGQAMEKLRVVADAFFKSREDGDSLSSQLPHLISATAQWMKDGSQCVVQVQGKNLHADSFALVNQKIVNGTLTPAPVPAKTETKPAPPAEASAATDQAKPVAAEAAKETKAVRLEDSGTLVVVLRGEEWWKVETVNLAVFNPNEHAGLSNILRVKLGARPQNPAP